MLGGSPCFKNWWLLLLLNWYCFRAKASWRIPKCCWYHLSNKTLELCCFEKTDNQNDSGLLFYFNISSYILLTTFLAANSFRHLLLAKVECTLQYWSKINKLNTYIKKNINIEWLWWMRWDMQLCIQLFKNKSIVLDKIVQRIVKC